MEFTIYPFMLKDLKLSGADLLIYAYLYNYAREYKESFRSLSRELNINIHTVLASVGRLIGKDILEQTEDGVCVKIDTHQGKDGAVSKLAHEPLGEGGVSKMTQPVNCVKNDTTKESVSKLTQNRKCAKIDTKLKLHRKEK